MEVRTYRLEQILAEREQRRIQQRKRQYRAWLTLIAAAFASGALVAITAVAVAALSHH